MRIPTRQERRHQKSYNTSASGNYFLSLKEKECDSKKKKKGKENVVSFREKIIFKICLDINMDRMES